MIKALENTLTGNVTDLLTKSASLTAERVAAKLEKIAASGSSLVSDMSATVAAGRDKVTVVLSRFVQYNNLTLPSHLLPAPFHTST